MSHSITTTHAVISTIPSAASSLSSIVSQTSSSSTFSTPPLSSPSNSPSQSASSNNQNNQGSDFGTSGALYLYTFLATLVLLLSVSSAIVVRSLIMRRRHNRMMAQAIANGTWFPNATNAQHLGEKPGFFEAFVNGSKSEGNVKIVNEKEEVDWQDIMPFSATYVTSPPRDGDGKAATTPQEALPTTPTGRHIAAGFASAVRLAGTRIAHRTPTTLLPLPVSARAVSPPSPFLSSPSPPSPGGALSSETPAPPPESQDSSIAVPPSSTLRVAVLIAMPAPPQPPVPQGNRSAYGDEEEDIPHVEFGVTEVDVVAGDGQVGSGR